MNFANDKSRIPEETEEGCGEYEMGGRQQN